MSVDEKKIGRVCRKKEFEGELNALGRVYGRRINVAFDGELLEVLENVGLL